MDTPKQRFQKTEHAKAFYDLSASQPFLVALDYAMLQLVHEQASNDMNNAAISGFRTDGAQRFVKVLLDLATVPTERKKASMPQNLPEV